jgi:hypothetical protein
LGRELGGVGQDNTQSGLVCAKATGVGVDGKIADVEPKKLQACNHRLDPLPIDDNGIALAEKSCNSVTGCLLFSDLDEIRIRPPQRQPPFLCRHGYQDFLSDLRTWLNFEPCLSGLPPNEFLLW